MIADPDLVLARCCYKETERGMALQLDLDRDRYVSLLEKLIGEVEL